MDEQNVEILKIRDLVSTILQGVFLSLIIFKFLGPSFLLIVLPLPYIYFIYKHGHRLGMIAVCMTAVFNLLFFGVLGLASTLVSCLIAIVLGGAFHEKFLPTKTLWLSIIVTVLAGLILFYLFSTLGFIDNRYEELETYMQIVEKMLNVEQTPEMRAEYIKTIFLVLPGMMVGALIIVGLINYYFAVSNLKRKGHDVEKIKPLQRWRFPRWLSILFVVNIIIPDVLSFSDLTTIVLLNIQAILLMVLFIESVAVIIYYSDKWLVYPLIRNIIIIIGFLIFSPGLIILALADNLFNLRRYKQDRLV